MHSSFIPGAGWRWVLPSAHRLLGGLQRSVLAQRKILRELQKRGKVWALTTLQQIMEMVGQAQQVQQHR